MESKIHRANKSAYVVIGPEGATNFAIVRANDGTAVLIDADIRRIDEVDEALKLTGCADVAYLVNTHEHFDHTSANFYFAQRGIPIVASAACARAMKGEGTNIFKTRTWVAMGYLYDETTRRVETELRANPESIRFHLEMAALDDPRAAKFSEKDFWDASVVDEIRRSGFVDQLYKK
jgi:glyoxylase-like metal-dependent hydrolase (beta-lactamase superfamily II)